MGSGGASQPGERGSMGDYWPRFGAEEVGRITAMDVFREGRNGKATVVGF